MLKLVLKSKKKRNKLNYQKKLIYSSKKIYVNFYFNKDEHKIFAYLFLFCNIHHLKIKYDIVVLMSSIFKSILKLKKEKENEKKGFLYFLYRRYFSKIKSILM